MTFTNITDGMVGLAAPVMGNFRHVNYGNPLIPVDSAGSGVDNTLALGSVAARWATIYGVSGFLQKDDDGATVGPTKTLYRKSTSPAANDVLGGVLFDGNNDTPSQVTYAQVQTVVESAANGAEYGRIEFLTRENGALGLKGLIPSSGLSALSGNATLTVADHSKLIYADNASSAFTITLPGSSACFNGFILHIASGSSQTNAITISRAGSDTIDGETSIVIGAYGSVTLVLDKTNTVWRKVGFNSGTVAFTPTLSNTSTYSHQYGRYIRIGNLVTAHIRISASSITQDSNIVTVSGLPFSAANTGDSTQRSSGVLGGDWVGWGSVATSARFRVDGSTLQCIKDSGGSSAYIIHTDTGTSIAFHTSVSYYMA